MTKVYVDQGKLIEAGWQGLRMMALSPDAPAVQLTEMRMAFMAGAQHLFASILSMLEGGDDATDADMRRMDLIQAELTAFEAEFKRRLGIRP